MAQDQMKLGDQFAIRLECGHPNKNAGERCELCGKTVPGVQLSAEQEKPAQESENEQ